MHTLKTVLILTASLALAGTAQAQAPIIIFDSGSTGALGDLVVTNDTTIVLPVDGILNYKSVTIKNNAAVGFIKNANNTPIYILSQGDVSIGGQIYISGGDGNSFGPGLGGPGGFDGGRRGVNTVPPGDGQGPGGGAAGDQDASNGKNSAGGGAYLTTVSNGTTNNGVTYGNAALIPLVGGSGGGGTPGNGGSGGGGAILIASNTRIDFANNDGNHFIDATGGVWSTGGAYNGGSGGAVKMVAPVIAGEQRIRVYNRNGTGGAGRVRLDASSFQGSFGSVNPDYSLSYGNMMATGLEGTLPKLELVSVAGKPLPTNSVATGFVLLPNGSSQTQLVVVRARNFGTIVPVRVVVSPDNGTTQYFDSTVDNTGAASSEKTVTVTIPANTPTKVFAWTR